MEGDIVDKSRQMKKEVLELYHRNSVECIKELIANLAFNGCIEYEPKWWFEDVFSEKPLIGEISSVDW